MSIKTKLSIIVSLFIILIAGNIGAVYTILEQKENDALLINISGRQRMLSQRISKNVFLLYRAKHSTAFSEYKERILNDLEKTVSLFDSTIKAFKDGGEVTDTEGNTKYINKIEDNGTVEETYEFWTKFKFSAESYIYSFGEEDLIYIYSQNEKLLALSNDIVTFLQENSDKKLTMLKVIQVVILVLSLIIFSIVFLILHRLIVIPIQKMQYALQELKKGNLRFEAEIRSNDEFGSLSRDFVDVNTTIKHIIHELQNSVETTKGISYNLLSSSEEVSSTLEEIHANIENMKGKTDTVDSTVGNLKSSIRDVKDFSQTVMEQAESQSVAINESSASIEQMSANINSVVNTVKNKIEIVENLKNIANDGEKEMAGTIDVINKITESAKTIMEMNEVINNIADRTNLLAMNAAIEAAHAGSAGKGFAVVADEIRKLAENTAKNAGEISRTIQSITSNITVSEQSSNRTGEYLTKIVTEVKGVSEAMEEINNSMHELNIGSNQILEALGSLIGSSESVKKSSVTMTEKTGIINKSIEEVNLLTTDTRNGMQEVTIGVGEIAKAVKLVQDSGLENSENVKKIEVIAKKFTL